MISRLIFGAVIGLLIAYPALLALVLDLAAQPSALAFAAGALAWPRLARRARGWLR